MDFEFGSLELSRDVTAPYPLEGGYISVLPDGCAGELFTILGDNWVLRSVKLLSFTDEYDTLTEERRQNVYKRSARDSEGGIFFLENYECGEAVFVASEAPEFVHSILHIRDGKVSLENERNTVALGFSRLGECEALCRAYFRSHLQYRVPLTMSNTWGDRNRYERVCEEFVLGEIAAARELGIDAMQIDDGWQRGLTADPDIFDGAGRRMFGENFWELSSVKFPRGMRLVTDSAREAGVRIGLWFAPDSHDGYALLERDLSVLKHAYEEWGVRFFKLDMYWIHTDADRDRFLELVRGIYAFGSDVSVELDVTRDIRVNYLFCKEYGTVFVENRYTKWGSAHPYRTLRNLWSLGRYLPTVRFQFEIVNPDLNRESYSAGDPFAPSLYSMDYLFASVMVSSPLFWMELQHLPEGRRRELKPLLDVWRSIRENFADADIIPIGDEPSGRSFTGFHIKRTGGVSYLLLIREVNDADSYSYRISTDATSARVLMSNADVKVNLQNGIVNAELSAERSYALIEIK